MNSLVPDVKFFWEAFVTLLVITDPPGVVPVFLGMTSSRPKAERNRLAWQAAVVALGVIVAFAAFGRSILTYLGVELPSLQAAGGLLLLLVALQLLTGQASDPTDHETATANVAFVPLGTPLLAGPGAIVATMLFVQRLDSIGTVVAFAARDPRGRGDVVAGDAVLEPRAPRAQGVRRGAAHQDRRPSPVRHRRPAHRRRGPRPDQDRPARLVQTSANYRR